MLLIILKTDMILQDLRKTVRKCPTIAANSFFVRLIWLCVDIGTASLSEFIMIGLIRKEFPVTGAFCGLLVKLAR